MKKFKILIMSIMLILLMGVPTVAGTYTPRGGIKPTDTFEIYDFVYTKDDFIGTYNIYNERYDNNYYGLTIPITVPSNGRIFLEGLLRTTHTSLNQEVKLYYDQKCSKECLDYYPSLNNKDKEYTFSKSIDITKGTYYLRICSYASTGFTIP